MKTISIVLFALVLSSFTFACAPRVNPVTGDRYSHKQRDPGQVNAQLRRMEKERWKEKESADAAYVQENEARRERKFQVEEKARHQKYLEDQDAAAKDWEARFKPSPEPVAPGSPASAPVSAPARMCEVRKEAKCTKDTCLVYTGNGQPFFVAPAYGTPLKAGVVEIGTVSVVYLETGDMMTYSTESNIYCDGFTFADGTRIPQAALTERGKLVHTARGYMTRAEFEKVVAEREARLNKAYEATHKSSMESDKR